MEENDGQINLAFEACTSEDNTNITKKDATKNQHVVPKHATKNPHVVPKHAFVVAEGEEEENVLKRSGLAFLGLCTLPEFFQKIFLKPAWVLVFLCWASATQVSSENNVHIEPAA